MINKTKRSQCKAGHKHLKQRLCKHYQNNLYHIVPSAAAGHIKTKQHSGMQKVIGTSWLG